MITFKDPQERVTFSQKSSFVSRPEREVYTVYIHDAPFELPDKALKLRLQPYGKVLRITRGRFPHCTHVETGIRYVKMHIDNPIPSFIRFGRRLGVLRTRVNSERAEDAINSAIRLKNVRRNFVSTASVLAMKLVIVLWRFFAVFVKIPVI